MTGRTHCCGFLSLLALLTFPMNLGLSLVAYPIIRIAFGAEWLGAVPLLQVLGVASMLGLFSAVGEALFSAHAWLRTILWMVATATALRIALLVLLIPHYGLLGGALGLAIAGAAQEAVYIATAMRRLRIQSGRCWRA